MKNGLDKLRIFMVELQIFGETGLDLVTRYAVGLQVWSIFRSKIISLALTHNAVYCGQFKTPVFECEVKI